MRKLFGNNITCNCEYCCYYRSPSKRVVCQKNKEIKDGKCKSFKYNPFKRKPKIKPKLHDLSSQDLSSRDLSSRDLNI